MNGRNLETDSGFTLLELLVAMAIFSVISIVTFQGLQSMLKNQEVMARENARLAGLQRAVMVMGRDFEQIVERSIRDEDGVMRASLLCDGGDKNYVEFSRGGWRNPANLPRSTIQRVAYRFEEGRLVRENWPVLDRGVRLESSSYELLTDVAAFQVRFLSSTEKWQTSWPIDEQDGDGQQQDNLPKALEISLDLNDWGIITRLFLLAPGRSN